MSSSQPKRELNWRTIKWYFVVRDSSIVIIWRGPKALVLEVRFRSIAPVGSQLGWFSNWGAGVLRIDVGAWPRRIPGVFTILRDYMNRWPHVKWRGYIIDRTRDRESITWTFIFHLERGGMRKRVKGGEGVGLWKRNWVSEGDVVKVVRKKEGTWGNV
jgi:hypothetical protein